jgi:hypothetical protein
VALPCTPENERENTMMTRAELEAAARFGAKLGGAKLGGAKLGGAKLGGADLGGADLRGANLRGANLGGADLRSADLRSADLRSADLGGANLGGADLGDQWIIQGAARSDGYPFFLQMLTGDKVPMVKAGCRLLTLPQAWKHWHETRAGQALLRETLVIIDGMVELAVIRGYAKREPNGAIKAIKLPK